MLIAKLPALSRQYGDGFYLLDKDTFVSNLEKLSEAFRKYYPKFRIAYSYKTNYIPDLCRAVHDFGGYAEVVSQMEWEIAKRMGVPSEEIIWNGPIKDRQQFLSCLKDGGTVILDNISEWDAVCAYAGEHPNIIFSLGIRVNFDIGDGTASRFGFDPGGEEFTLVCQGLQTHPRMRFTELQCHFANRKLEYWEPRTRGMLKIADRLEREYGLRPERFDLGGGIYGEMPESLESQLGYKFPGFDAYAQASAKLMAEHFGGDSGQGLDSGSFSRDDLPELVIEPGTAVAANCMSAVFRVMNIRTIRGRAIATVYGSQKNIGMSGLNPPMTVVSGGGQQEEYSDLDIAGYTCIESDYLYRGFHGKLAVGDFLIFGNSGSYSVVMKPPFILPNFPIIDISGGEMKLVKRAETFEDLFSGYSGI